MSVCSRCGKSVKLISGIKCPKCDHVLGSQNLDIWSKPHNELGLIRAPDSDSQTKLERKYNPKRRYPLRFEE